MPTLRPGLVVVIVGAVLNSLSTVIIALRYYSRHFLIGSVKASDYLIFTALVLTWGNFVVNYYQDASSSRIKPSWFLKPEKRVELETHLRSTLISWWVYRQSYITALCFVKLSILFFYRAIASQRTFRRLVYATMAFVVLSTFSACVAAFFQCETPSNAWNTNRYLAPFDQTSATNQVKLNCYDPKRLGLFCGAANLLSDVVILLLPIPALLGLRVPTNKRLALIAIFSIGSMGIVASCVRMWVMMMWAESPSGSARFGADLLLWGQIETNAGIISGSMPFLRLLFRNGVKKEGDMREWKSEFNPPEPTRSPDIAQQMEFCTGTWDPNGKDESEASQTWGAFITIPATLDSVDRGSVLLEPARPHFAV